MSVNQNCDNNNNKVNNNKEEVKRKGILFVYGAEWCNPNGDPAFDNEPRIRGGRVYVTDVFLKRRLRDYVYYKYKDSNKKIVLIREVRKGEVDKGTNDPDALLTLAERVERIYKEYKNQGDSQRNQGDSQGKINILLDNCWDVRVFGVMAPIPKGSGERGTSIKLIGPVQVSFGISLNLVEKLTVEITRVLATETSEKKSQGGLSQKPSSEEDKGGGEKYGGAIGYKHIVPVAIIEQYLFVNDIVAKETKMTNDDYNEIICGLKNFGSIPTSRTSSKNLWPIMIVEVNFKGNEYGNLMGLLEVEEKKETPSTIRDYYLNVRNLVEKLKELEKSNDEKNMEKSNDEKPYKFYIKKEYKDIIKELNVEEDKIEYF